MKYVSNESDNKLVHSILCFDRIVYFSNIEFDRIE